MALTRFDPPAKSMTLIPSLFAKHGVTEISSMINDNKADLQVSLGANPPQFFNELTDLKNMADRVEQDIIWQGFPDYSKSNSAKTPPLLSSAPRTTRPAPRRARHRRMSISSGTLLATIRRPRRSYAWNSAAKDPNTGSSLRESAREGARALQEARQSISGEGGPVYSSGRL